MKKALERRFLYRAVIINREGAYQRASGRWAKLDQLGIDGWELVHVDVFDDKGQAHAIFICRIC